MAFVRFACFLLVALPVTSLSIMKFHREDKDAAQDNYGLIEKEILSSNNIGGRRFGMQDLMLLERSKILGGGSKEKISKMGFSSSSIGESGNKNKKISRLERKKLGNGSSAVYNADYMTYMHHPPKHN